MTTETVIIAGLGIIGTVAAVAPSPAPAHPPTAVVLFAHDAHQSNARSLRVSRAIGLHSDVPLRRRVGCVSSVRVGGWPTGRPGPCRCVVGE